MKIEHTPGPWRVGPYYKHEVVSDHGVICCAHLDTGETRANAKLIAAAPDLLEALEAFIEWDNYHGKIYSENNPSIGKLLAQARTAVRTAKGAE